MTVGGTAVDTTATAGKGEEQPMGDSGNISLVSSPEGGIALDSGSASIPSESIYKLTIQPTVGEPFDTQVNTAEMIQELHQLLLERESTCHRTCFCLQLNGQTLDNFTEIRNIPDLVDGSTLTVVDEPFTLREGRIHLRHIRELLRCPDSVEAANAIDGASLTYLPSVNIQERKDKDKPFDGQPPEYVLPGAKERPLNQLLPPTNKLPQAVKNIAISSFNPPPGPRKMKGDVLYFIVDSMEKRRLHITCCTKGFFVNSSTDEVFDPTPSNQHKNVYHSLVDLLNAVSPGFKKAYPVIIKKRSERHILDRLPTPYPVHSWLVPQYENPEDGFRSEDSTLPHRVGFEDHLPGQIRDWNEELQTTHEMPRASLPERLIRDRSISKIHGDFIGAAVKGATAVIDGNVMAINPADEPKTHMFIWNNIFFSLGFDVKDHYKEFGGDAASFAATTADLQGVKAYAAVDDPKLCTLGMAVIDYKGYRITAQSIIPGILDREQEQSVIYGSIDFGKTVLFSEKYHESLESAAKQLKILPHEVVSADGKTVKLYSSYETKGIIGNDGRQYILDLLRTMPPDVHFMEGVNVSDKAKEMGFPRKHPHKLAALRQELVEIFYETRCLQFIRIAAEIVRNDLMEKHGKEKNEKFAAIEAEITRILLNVSEGNDPDTTDSKTTEALAKAAKEVNSLKPNTFEIRFNPDCFSTTVVHAPTEDLEKQRALLVEAAEFILTNQLPEFVQNCIDCSITPIDGEALCDLMHSRGINVRYLGEVVKRINAVSQTSYIRPLAIAELICRCFKHVLRQYIYPLPQDKLAVAISHILKSVFGAPAADGRTSPAEKQSKKNNKNKSKKSASNEEWSSLTTKSVWKAACDEALSYYGLDLQVDSIDALVEQYGVQKISILRRLCKTLGIQLLSRDYNLELAKGKPVFTEDDIQGLYPITKHRQPCAVDAKKFFQRGQQYMQMAQLREAYEYIAESITLMTSVYGTLHSELAQALRMLARLSFILGDSAEALAQQHKATMVSERCNGLDHGYTIIEYINLAHFAFSNLYISAALRLLYRARYLLLLAHGEKHPTMTQIDGNIGVILFAVQEYDSALKFLQSAKNGCIANGEPKRLKSALLEHIIAACHASRGDFRAALTAEKETYSTYLSLFGAEHERTQDSSEYLKQLTQQAVAFQKRMNQANKGSSIAQLLPIPIQQPSLSSILDIMNILNGIIIIAMGSGADNKDVKIEEPTTEKQLTDDALD